MSTIRTLELVGLDPKKWGEQHGESFRDDVRGIYDIRLGLTIARTDLQNEKNVLALARHHLPLLERFDRNLYDELCGIARGAHLTPEQIVVINHYTDLRDLTKHDLDVLETGKDPGGCSAMFLNTPNGRVLGQTWDMHGSAEPFALLITVPGGPEGVVPSTTNPAGIPKSGHTLLFSITGCLGMTGLTSWGLGLTINNLNSTDATLGVVWSALVRKALRAKNAVEARDRILHAPIGSGRHYIVADDTDVFGIETSGTQKKVIRAGGMTPYFHTNHCIDDAMKATNKILPGSTTLQRYETCAQMVASQAPSSSRELFDAFERVGLRMAPHDPHSVSTCGALVMDLTHRDAIACMGVPGPDADSIGIEVRP
jgi:isopenicillin-N N-acyltransferase-like protein